MFFDQSSVGTLVACLIGILTLSCAPSQPAEIEPLPETIVSELTIKEKAFWEACQKKDIARLRQLLSDEYVVVSDRGPLNKAGAIACQLERNISQYSLRDVRATLLGSNSVLLTYTCSATGYWHGAAFDNDYLCSDVWINRGGNWQSILFMDRPRKS